MHGMNRYGLPEVLQPAQSCNNTQNSGAMANMVAKLGVDVAKLVRRWLVCFGL